MAADRQVSNGLAEGKLTSRHAPLVMLAVVPMYAFVPLLVFLVSDETSQWGFVGVWYVTVAFLSGALLRFRKSNSGNGGLSERGVVYLFRQCVKKRYFAISMVASLQWPLFVAASQHADISVVTIVFEFWPVFLALITMTAWFGSKAGIVRDASSGRHARGLADRPRVQTVLLLLIAGLGVSISIMSERGDLQSLDSAAAFGVVLAIAASITYAGGAAAATLSGADTLTSSLTPEESAAVSVANYTTVRFVMGTCLLAIAVLVDGWSAFGVRTVVIAISLGLLNAVSARLYLYANHLAIRESAVAVAWANSVYYLVPVAALVILGLYGAIDVDRPSMLAAGASGVVVVNMIMHLDPENVGEQAAGYGYRAIVLSLWLSGIVVAFREDWMPTAWEQTSAVEYWGIIGVCATVFVLIMSFRQSRLNERRTAMDEMMLRLHAKILTFNETGVLARGAEIARLLRSIDRAAKPSSISRHYNEIRDLLAVELTEKSSEHDSGSEKVRLLMADIDVFANLRRQGRNFAELAVMTLFAVLTVVLALLVRPASDEIPFAAFVNDVVSMVLAAAFAFLVFDLVDKRRDADAPVVQSTKGMATEQYAATAVSTDWRLALQHDADPTVDRWISSVLGAAVLAIFVAILYFKWLPT